MATEDNLYIVSSDELGQPQVMVSSTPNELTEPVDISEHVNLVDVNRGLIDTATPFESVRAAVTKFGGIVDWKAHKMQTVERGKHVQLELEKTQEEIPEYKKQSEAAEDAKEQVLKELDNAKRLIEELKLNLERVQTEEYQAKQDSELARLRVKEMEQGIADEASIAAKAQLEVAKARHMNAVADLKSVNDELESLRGAYASLVNERNMVLKRSEETVSALKEIEMTMEEFTLELITAKESLESAQATHLEAEELRIAAAIAKEQDSLTWEKELKQTEEELERLNEQLQSAKDLKSKLDTASAMRLNLKSELASYMESKLNQENDIIEEVNPETEPEETKKAQTATQAEVSSVRNELEEVRLNIEKVKDDVRCLRVAAVSLKLELQREQSALATMRQREGMASVAVSSLKTELNKILSELELIHTKEKEAKEKMVELPKELQQAAQQADVAKLAAQLAREELRKAKEEVEQAKASASTTETRFHAAMKEIEAAKASERLALAATKALQESDTDSGVTLPLEEYFALSKRAHEAEELANMRVEAAISQIELAKKSELVSLEKLEEENRKRCKRNKALTLAMEKAEKAKEGKLGAEQELRMWRAEHEQRRKAGDTANGVVNTFRSPWRSSEEWKQSKSFDAERDNEGPPRRLSSPNLFVSGDDMENATREPKVRKKKSLFPRIVMFLARMKAHHN
eukprot:TRINITY_DN487_c0_g4_i1.p1 TRINITY_DN487_c0_g4~~TRINITY_DN487_c0_g4_i1.p1  ORF type:complete len:711 (+),score=212.81 TRINITY_DN487_c0_g4_i1:55-2133(+)